MVDVKFRRVLSCGGQLVAISMFRGRRWRTFLFPAGRPPVPLLIDKKWQRMHGEAFKLRVMVVGIDWYARDTCLLLTWGAFERNQSENYPVFATRVGILTDMWSEWEDLCPIAAVLNHLLSVLIYVEHLPKCFVDLLFFLCARGSHECLCRSMPKCLEREMRTD